MQKNIIPLLVSILFIGILNQCSNNPSVPAYLKEYKKEFRSDPRKINLEWFANAKYGLFIHYGLYSKALETLAAGKDLPAVAIHVCDVCGNTVIGEVPDGCPVCGAAKTKFKEVA